MKSKDVIKQIEMAAATVEALLSPVNSAEAHVNALMDEVSAVQNAATQYKAKLRELINSL